MPRRIQPPGSKGSLKWVQVLVNEHPEVLNQAIGASNVEWLSPLASDGYAEHWDRDFLDRLGVRLTTRGLHTFWPPSGPRWDALGRIPGTSIILEAKAHAGEMTSVCRARERSTRLIKTALNEVSRQWGVDVPDAWLTTHYQYVNRLAHAFLLNELNDVPARMVFLYLIGDRDMRGPTTRNEWEGVIQLVRRALGVEDRLPVYIVDAFVDVSGPVPIAA